MRSTRLCSIVPPHVVRAIAANGDDVDRALPGRNAGDVAAGEAYDGAAKTNDYFLRVHGRRVLDSRSIVRFGERFRGDRDGKYFRRFTSSLDIVAHELTHRVTQRAAALGSSGQCGALAEHFSDVFGMLVKQYWRKQTVTQSDWLIGAELLTSRVNGAGLRSLKAPGTAYDDPVLGRDPQPAHMRGYVKTDGAHVNCGIPNHAFYRAAMLLGGRAWEVAGPIWYRTLARELGPRSRFQQCADATWRVAGELYGVGSAPQDAVRIAWGEVGIVVVESVSRVSRRGVREAFDIPVAAAELPHLA